MIPSSLRDSKEAIGNCCIVAGGLSLQNHMLADLIRERIGMEVVLVSLSPEDAELAILQKLKIVLHDSEKVLLLVDYQACINLSIWESCMTSLRELGITLSICLFNAEITSGLLDFVYRVPEVKGLIGNNASSQQWIPAIKEILKGYCWVPREFLVQHFERTRTILSSKTKNDVTGLLTPKEMKILQYVARGYTNTEISEALCISLHTTKRHLYNLYRKLNVDNRVQAALQIMEHLPSESNK
jgi:DNA-binding CsgD family transcriptional regulator